MTVAGSEHWPALRDLAERYAAGVDRRDPGLFLSAFDAERASLLVFEPSESGQPRGVRRGRGELADVVTRVSRHDRTFHLLGNSRYDVRGDEATGEVYCVAHQIDPVGDGGRTDHVMYIRYHDHYERGDAGWQIVERRVLVDWTETRRLDP